MTPGLKKHMKNQNNQPIILSTSPTSKRLRAASRTPISRRRMAAHGQYRHFYREQQCRTTATQDTSYQCFGSVAIPEHPIPRLWHTPMPAAPGFCNVTSFLPLFCSSCARPVHLLALPWWESTKVPSPCTSQVYPTRVGSQNHRIIE